MSYLENNGSKLTYTTANTPQHNGIVERMNGILMEIARAMLVHAGAPVSLWGEALNYAAFVHNNTPQPVIQGQIPYALLFGKHYLSSKFKVFGCDCFVYLDESVCGKFESRFRRGIFVGYDLMQNGFRILNPDTKRITVSRNVKMLESSFELVQYGVKENNYDILDSILKEPIYSDSNPPLPTQSSAPEPQVVTDPIQSGSHLDEPIPIDESEPQFESDDQQDVEIVSPPENMEPTSAPARLPSIPEVSPSPSPSSTSRLQPLKPKSREVRELERNAISMGSKRPPSVPSRAKAGLNQVTYPSGTDRLQITTAERSQSRFGRTINPVIKKRFHLMVSDPDAQELLASLVSGGIINEPKTYKQAMNSPDAPKWEQAMKEELDSLKKLGTWILVPRPKDVKPITAKWVFKIKLDANNQPTRFKARLVARGFQQTHGIDYDETFAPVVKIKSLKLILSWAADEDLEIKQIDFDTAFLNAELEHEVYMELPEGSNHPPGTVIKLLKSLYGLKQAGHDWHHLARDVLIKLGYKQLKCDTCVFIKRLNNGRMIVIPLYVDDAIAVFHPDDEPIWQADKSAIASQYAIKDLGDCNWILNMKLVRNRETGTITLSQQAYVERVLETFNQENAIPMVQPCPDYDLFLPPSGVDTTPLNKKEQTRYQAIVGSLLYAALTTRPDISFATNELGRFNSQATQAHMHAALHYLKYLSGTANYGLCFTRNNGKRELQLHLEIFSDASWGNDLETRRSTSGMVVKFNGNIVSWSSRKQKTVALSSTEAEYMAASEATCEALWLRTWVMEVFRVEVPVIIYCDNQSAIALSSNDKFHQRTKHIDIRYHLIRENVAAGYIKLHFIPTADQEADILTKKLQTGKDFKRQRDRMMVMV